jgi:hypothetical protein
MPAGCVEPISSVSHSTFFTIFRETPSGFGCCGITSADLLSVSSGSALRGAAGGLLAEVSDLVDQGALTALPFRSFPASRIDAAFRLMAGGKHTGKVVVGFAEPFIVRKGEPALPDFEIKSDGAYLITGGLGGFGRVLSEWLVTAGARHLVLSSRSGASTPETVEFVESLVARGIETKVIKADIGSPADVKSLISEIRDAEIPLKRKFPPLESHESVHLINNQ